MRSTKFFAKPERSCLIKPWLGVEKRTSFLATRRTSPTATSISLTCSITSEQSTQSNALFLKGRDLTSAAVRPSGLQRLHRARYLLDKSTPSTVSTNWREKARYSPVPHPISAKLLHARKR